VRIALVTSGFSPALGGVEHHVLQLALGLAASGDEVTVLTNRIVPGSAEQETLGGVRVMRFPMVVSAPDFRYSAAMLRHLRAARGIYDVVHAHSYHALAAVNAMVAGSRPLIFTPHYHGTGHSRLRALLHTPFRPVGRAVLHRATAVICVSQAEARWLCGDFPHQAGKITMIPNGTERPQPSQRALEASPVTKSDILTAGRLVPYKGIDRLVDALPRLTPATRLMVIGHGPCRQALLSTAAARGVADRVLLLGGVEDDDLQAAIQRAGLVASLSAHEAFGLSIARALAAGVPVVASDIPAHREVLAMSASPGGGRLVDRDQPDAVVEALQDVLTGPRPAPSTALPTWPDVVHRTRAVYQAALAAPAGRIRSARA